MRTNLIQTYMNNLNNVPSPKDRELNIEYVLSNRTFIKPLPGKGHIVNNTVFELPAAWSKDVAYDFKSLRKSEKGIANDHELGKVNDMGMKLGGIAIALYLMTRKQTPLKKAMELIGFASFFGAMALWPKIAIHLPAKLIHGVNVGKKYEDSFGRKKPFFQDPQYLPWDLADEKRINKIGDRMGIPKDMPNRRDAIQDKMKQVAVQSNTLWMLTAGFATPILSALMCNVLEKPTEKLIDKYNSRRAQNLIENINAYANDFIDESVNENLEKLISKENTLTPDLAEKIKALLTKDFDPITAEAIKKDIDNITGVTNRKYNYNNEVLEKVISGIKKSTGIQDFAVDTEKLTQQLSGYVDRELTELDLKKIQQIIGRETKFALKTSGLSEKEIQAAITTLLNKDNTIMSVLKSSGSIKLNEELIDKLYGISDELLDFKSKNKVLDKYIRIKVGAAPETLAANGWNQIADELPKILKLSDKDIANIRHDRKLAGEMLRGKIEQIVSVDAEYEKVLTKLTELIKNLDEKIKIEPAAAGVSGGYENAVNDVFDTAAEKLRKLGFSSTAESFVGKNGDIRGSLKNIQLSYSRNRLLGIRSSMYRLLNTFDLYKRISDGKNFSDSFNGMRKEIKEEMIELAKKLSIEGTNADFMTKFFALRNTNPSAEFGNILSSDGKVINEFLEKAVSGGRAEIPGDKVFFQEVMKLMFGHNLHPTTEKVISSPGWSRGLQQYRETFLREIGNHKYFAKVFHNLGGQSTATSYEKFLLMGNSPDQMLSNVVKRTFNTKKWLKMFGGFGAGLFAVTVLAQFFFGKTSKVRENA